MFLVEFENSFQWRTFLFDMGEWVMVKRSEGSSFIYPLGYTGQTVTMTQTYTWMSHNIVGLTIIQLSIERT